jgi:FkbM family methyltransferase
MDFRPLQKAQLPWLRRALLPLRAPVNRVLRWTWAHTGHSRSTWFDSRRWRAVWNVNRFFAATPRAEREVVQVAFDRGIRMELDLSRLTDVLAYCYGPGEIEVGHACRLLCPPDGVVCDVGGNIGTTTLSFAATVPQGRVHVFEPSREMLPILRRNLDLSQAANVTVHPFGLSDAPSRGHLQVAIDGNPGSAFFVEGAAAGDEIEVQRLDDVLAGAPRLDFVKIDVEGYELRVLRGAEGTLRRLRPAVLFEVNEAALRRGGTSGAEVCAFLQGLGYRLHWLDRGRLRDYDPATMLARKLHNVIAVHPERVR